MNSTNATVISEYNKGLTTASSLLVKEQFGSADVFAQNAKSILNKATGFIGAYDFTLNPYRGCQYGCSYCYAAAFSPNKKMREDWGKWVIIKENAAEVLEAELAIWRMKNPEKFPRIYMSSVTDPYQPIESKAFLTRRLLEVMLEYRPILVIQTRSPIITRDIEILQRFQRLRINMSIPTGSEGVRKDFEPLSPSIKARINALKKIRDSVDLDLGFMPKLGVTITPLLPTFQSDRDGLIRQLHFVDRIVIQDFHPSKNQSLVGSTREEALALKEKYSWWYNKQEEKYRQFKNELRRVLTDVELTEGKEGFGYD
ncbi:MAG: radical SAM protein [Cyanobacteriota bacterium]|nr:radical SAM protein [Cyanobacteriota bacterium]